MNIIYKINKLEIAPIENSMVNVVKIIHYSVKMIDNLYEAEAIGTVDLQNPNASNFIAFDSLSESMVIDWLKSLLDEPTIKASLQNKINSLKNPTVYLDPPWINNPTN